MNRNRSDLESKDALQPLVTDSSSQRKEYLRRRDAFEYMSCHPSEQQTWQAERWQVHREGKSKVQLKRPKPHDVMLEDQAWCLFYRMGYPELNGRQFRITYERRDGSVGEKQVDVFAKDDETVVVAECKSKEVRGRRSLQKDLHETDSLQKALAMAVQNHYGAPFKPKFIWLYITTNIIWSDPDVERAGAMHVRIITENEMQYFDSFIHHMGPAGRYQFLAEFLEGQQIPGLSGHKIPATRGTLGGRKFYSFVSTPRHLLKIAFVNHLALNHPDGRPAYQRMVSPSRIKEIQRFIEAGGYFPTNILINFTEPCRFDLLSNKENTDLGTKFGWLYLPNKYKSAWIIDGQHRLYGYSHLKGRLLDQPVAVIAFERMAVKDEAELFVTINQKQKSVQRSVIISLQADLKIDSADPKEKLGAIASTIAKQLNVDPTSPMAQRFTIQGMIAAENQSLTIPELVNGLVRSGLLGRVLHGNHVPGPLSSATDEQTFVRAKRILNTYFSNVRDANPGRWDGAREHYVSTNPGVRAHLLLLAEVCKYIEHRKGLDAALLDEDSLTKQIIPIVDPVLKFLSTASDTEMQDKFSRKFGEGGVKDYFENLCEIVCAKAHDFGSEELRKGLALRGDKRITQANADVISLNRAFHDYIVKKLKQVHGTQELKSGQKAYWEIGVENQRAKSEAYQRQLQDPREKQPLEAYLNILELRDVVRQRNNWPDLEPVFNIPLPGEKGKHYYLDWMARFNDLRKIPAHPTGGRTYTEADYEFIRFIKEELGRRLSKEEATH